jgi:hypothetical protein
MAWVPDANPAVLMSSIMRKRNGVIEVSYVSSTRPARMHRRSKNTLTRFVSR